MVKSSLKISLNNVIIVLLFITPHIFLSILPKAFSLSYSLIIYSFALFFFIIKSYYLSIKYKTEILFALCFIFLGLINLLVKNSTSLFNIISPLFGLFGYLYLRNTTMNMNIIKYVFICFYFYFYFVYYSVIPDYFFRPGFDEDAIVFENSSSNAISMALNMFLFIYLILNKYYNSCHSKTIFYLSIINLALIFIQQSRAGLLVAFLLFFISFYENNKKSAKRFFILFLFIVLSAILYYYRELLNLYNLFFGEYSIISISEDVRSEAQTYFFSNFNLKYFFFGYPENTVFASHIDSDILYTYNVFLDVWNRYGFLNFVMFCSVLLFRFYNNKRYYFPLYYFLPFLTYSFVESIFFPNYWDCFIYLLIFTPINKQKLNAY
jgi:hypothetical protein